MEHDQADQHVSIYNKIKTNLVRCMDIGHTTNLMKRQKIRLKLNVLPNCHSKASIFATPKKRTQLFYTPDSIRGDPSVLRCALHRCCNLHRKRGAPVQKDTRAAAVLEFASRSVWSEWEVGKNSRKKKSHRTKHMVRDWKEYWLHNTKKEKMIVPTAALWL